MLELLSSSGITFCMALLGALFCFSKNTRLAGLWFLSLFCFDFFILGLSTNADGYKFLAYYFSVSICTIPFIGYCSFKKDAASAKIFIAICVVGVVYGLVILSCYESWFIWGKSFYTNYGAWIAGSVFLINFALEVTLISIGIINGRNRKNDDNPDAGGLLA